MGFREPFKFFLILGVPHIFISSGVLLIILGYRFIGISIGENILILIEVVG